MASKATRVTDEMFSAAAKCLDEQVSKEDFEKGRIFPSLTRIRDVSANIALAVAKIAFAGKLTHMKEPPNLPGYIKAQMYDPVYQPYVK